MISSSNKTQDMFLPAFSLNSAAALFSLLFEVLRKEVWIHGNY